MTTFNVIYSDALGWRVQAEVLRSLVDKDFPNLTFKFFPYRIPKLLRPLLKDTYGAGWPKRLNLVTSIDLSASAMCRDIAPVSSKRLIFLGGNSVGLLAHASPETSAVLITDITAALARDQFGAKFSERDIQSERRAFGRCTQIFAMSTNCLESLERHYRFPREKLGLFLPPVLERRQRRPRSKNKFVIGFVGGDFDRKGGLILLEAFRSMENDGTMQLIIVSERCPKIVDSNIKVFGRLSNSTILNDIMPQFDVFCLPTLSDCSGISIAEAMSIGIPVVCTDIPGISDLVTHDKTGLIVPLNDPTAVARSLGTLRSDIALRTRLADQAYLYARRNFDARTNFNKVLIGLRGHERLLRR